MLHFSLLKRGRPKNIANDREIKTQIVFYLILSDVQALFIMCALNYS